MTEGFAWILASFLDGTDLLLQMQGWLLLRPLLPSMGARAFAEQVRDYANSSFGFEIDADAVILGYAIALYDAVMLYSHAATKVLLKGGDLFNGTAVTEAVRSTAIVGFGNTSVVLDERGDRIQSYEVLNVRVAQTAGRYEAQTFVHEGSNRKHTCQL